MNARLLLASTCGLLAHAASAQAQTTPPIKPGLWQVQSEREMDGKQVPDLSEQFKSMSPQMRQHMQDSMKQHGVDMSGGPGQMKMCMTRESLDAGRWQGEQSRCKTEFTSRSNSAWKWRATCDQPPSVTDGEATFASAESYVVKNSTTMTHQGRSHLSKMTLRATWLNADCGDLKPIAPIPKAVASSPLKFAPPNTKP